MYTTDQALRCLRILFSVGTYLMHPFFHFFLQLTHYYDYGFFHRLPSTNVSRARLNSFLPSFQLRSLRIYIKGLLFFIQIENPLYSGIYT